MERFFKGNDYMKKRFLTGIFHPIEIEEFKSRDEGQPRLQYVASRWALKEALVKASGETRLSYPDIYLHKEPRRQSTEMLSDGRELTVNRKQKPKLVVTGELNTKFLI